MLEQCRTVARRAGEDGIGARGAAGELGGEHGAVARSRSRLEGQEEEPPLPCCWGRWWQEQQGGYGDLLGLVSGGKPGAPHRSAVPATMLGKPSSSAVPEQQTPLRWLHCRSMTAWSPAWSGVASHLSQCCPVGSQPSSPPTTSPLVLPPRAHCPAQLLPGRPSLPGGYLPSPQCGGSRLVGILHTGD